MATRNLKRRACSIKDQADLDFDAAVEAFNGSSGAGIFPTIQEAPTETESEISKLATVEIKKVAIEPQEKSAPKVDQLSKLEDRIAMLEKKADVACPKCNDIAPQSYIEALVDMEQRTDCFERPVRMSVNLARSIQHALVETTSLNLGKEAAIILKVKHKSQL
jgi:hypothetical protein